jgi:hypothetical protein
MSRNDILEQASNFPRQELVSKNRHFGLDPLKNPPDDRSVALAVADLPSQMP